MCQATGLTVLVHEEARNLKDRAREQTREERLAAHGKSADKHCPQLPVCNGLFCLFGCCAGRTDLLRALHIRGFTNPPGEAFPLLSVVFYFTTGDWNHKTTPARRSDWIDSTREKGGGQARKTPEICGKALHAADLRRCQVRMNMLVMLLNQNELIVYL